MKNYIVKNIAKITFISLAGVLLSNKTFAQGCVAIRGTGNACTIDHMTGLTQSSWLVNINNRYFKSFRHFVGKVEQKQRVEEGSDVRNYSYTMDISITRNFNNRFSATIGLPYNHNDRSSLYEHGGQGRHMTSSSGLGDLRLSVYGLVFNPSKPIKGNIQLGLGVKFPTGKYRAMSGFHTSKGVVEGPVDQSIQLGDGGTGIVAEINTNYSISPRVNVYGSAFYLANPRETNGVSTARGGTASATAILYSTDVMSVPDQYMVRVGANVFVKKATLAFSIKEEGLPYYDLIGGNRGFRRPGYILSAEPGIIRQVGKVNIYAYVPIAILRNRTQSYPDRLRSQATQTYVKGDAAFSDYAINTGLSFKF